MYLLWKNKSKSSLIMVIGQGLIGSSIVRAIKPQICSQDLVEYYRIPWSDKAAQKKTLKSILNQVHPLLKRAHEIEVIWSAGKAGFACNNEEARQEFSNYETVIDWVSGIQKNHNIKTHVNLISSLGGIFEKAELVDRHSKPEPIRAYGYLKLEQERRLALEDNLRTRIYRVSSAYGPASDQHRVGLIPTLISKGVCKKKIFLSGSYDTRRDYIWVNDVAAYVVNNLSNRINENQIQFIASYQSYSIQQIVEKVESLINEKLLLIPSDKPTNARSISICPSLRPSDLRTSGIDKTLLSIINSL